MEPLEVNLQGSSPLEELSALPQLPERERARALERLFRDPSPTVRQAAARLGADLLSEHTVVSYLRNGVDDVLRNAAAEMLKHGGIRSVAIARLLLHDRDKDVVLHAILLLEHFRDVGAVESLRQLLGHPEPNVVQATITALGHVGHAGIAAEILQFLRCDLWLQMATIEALGRLRSQTAVKPLAELLKDPMLGALAADALSRIGGTEAFGHLGSFIVNSDGDVRDRLEQLAGTIEGPIDPAPEVAGLSAVLRGYLSDEDCETRTASARCLLAMGPGEWDTEALDVLATGWVTWPTLPGCLRRRPDLIPSLLNADGIKRRWGFRLAEEYPTRVPADIFAEALATTKEHEQLDAAAAALLAAAGDSVREQVPKIYSGLPATMRESWAPVVARFREEIPKAALKDPNLDAVARDVLDVVIEEDASVATRKLLEMDTPVRLEALAHMADRPGVLSMLPWEDWLSDAPELYGPLAVRYSAIADLTKHLPTIRATLGANPHRDLIRLVGRLRDEESVPMLLDLISSGPESFMPFALAALGTIGGDQARRALRGYCAEEWKWTRLAYRALAECVAPTDFGPFRAGVEHPDWHVRMICAAVLREAGLAADKARLAVLSTDPVAAVAAEAQGVKAA